MLHGGRDQAGQLIEELLGWHDFLPGFRVKG
jgi:hypothetical protein